MNVKLENYLCNRFSPFFEGKGHSFDCSDGWFFILNWAFLRIERSLKRINEEKTPEDKDSFIVLQTKEKFGTLRLYYAGTDSEEIRTIVSNAESLSGFVCEETGVFNETVGSNSKGWIKTLAKDQAGFNTGWTSQYDNDLLAILEEIKLTK